MRISAVVLPALLLCGCMVTRGSFETLARRKLALEERVAVLEREGERVAAERASLEALVGKASSDLAEAEGRLRELRGANAEMRARLAGAEERAAELDVRAAECGRSLERISAEMASLERAHDRLEREKADIVEKYGALMRMYEELRRAAAGAPAAPPAAGAGD
ncbi:MAG: hypothetical protein PHN82_10845 [bacterium]|nr:hypothetical protein [bacterium]